jgi:hypothetical protein
VKIYFYCRPFEEPKKAGYQHNAVGLAQGLIQLGHDIYSNADYWRLSPDSSEYLFSKDSSITPSDCDIEIISSVLFSYDFTPENITNNTENPLILLDSSDGYFGVDHKTDIEFDVVLRSHMSRFLDYPAHHKKWAFGLTSRMMEYTSNSNADNKNPNQILLNYRVDHSVRKVAGEKILQPLSEQFEIDTRVDDFDKDIENSYDYHLWKLTGRRHYPDYYQRLNKSIATAAFGGRFMPHSLFLFNPQLTSFGIQLEERLTSVRRMLDACKYGVFQWDSYRLWEAWAAGSIPLHLDFDQYGFLLPVSPTNYKHYIGFDLNQSKKSVNKMSRHRNRLDEIATAGKEWARDNYSPRAQAERFISTIYECTNTH